MYFIFNKYFVQPILTYIKIIINTYPRIKVFFSLHSENRNAKKCYLIGLLRVMHLNVKKSMYF